MIKFIRAFFEDITLYNKVYLLGSLILSVGLGLGTGNISIFLVVFGILFLFFGIVKESTE